MAQAFRIAHLSDLHLGYKSTRITTAQGVNVREADGYVAFGKVVADVIKKQVDAVLVSGDVFHSASPEVRPIYTAQYYFRQLAASGIPVYILAGNHDSNDVRADIASSRLMDDELRGIQSFIKPYSGALQLADDVFLHMVSHHMYGEQYNTMKAVEPVKGAVNIFATHGSVIDPLLKEKLHTEQSPREIVIPDFLFEDHEWSYSMLGHIHERGYVGSADGKSDSSQKKIFYNGSLIRRGFSDKECKLGRGWTEWILGTDGSFTPVFHTVAQRPQVDFEIIDARSKTPRVISDEIITNLRATQTEGEEFDYRVAPILRQKIKNLDPAKHAALDWAAINHHTKHTLQWNLRQVSDATAVEEKQNSISADDLAAGLPEGSDVVKIYDDWVKNSETMETTDETIRDTVKDQSRAFVELGQEVMLNE